MTTLPSIMLCPAGTTHTASSRLRCHVLARELQRLGCTVQLGFDAAVLPDVLYVQKVSSPEIIDHARRVRANGGSVVFDIDDWGDALPWVQSQPQLLADLLAHCDVVSVDTEVRAEVLAKEAAYRDVPAFWVVPDPVDYIDAAPTAAAPQDAKARLAGCWFGNAPNLPPSLPYIQAALATDRVGRFDVITNAQFVPQMQKAWPMLGVEGWQLETFPQRLRDHDFCLLIHDTNLEGIQKSNNKMLAALGQGVVPLVSNTPAYAETAARIGLPDLVLGGAEDIAARLEGRRLSSLLAGVRGEACRNALREFMPATVARAFLDRLKALRSAPLARISATPSATAKPAAQPAPASTGKAQPFQQFGTGNVIEFGPNVEVSGYVNGNHNRIVIAGAESPTRLHILVNGDGNRIVIDRNTELKGLLVCCGNHVRAHDTELHIGENTTVEGGGRFFLYNSGNVLHIGKNTMLSSNITIRCGESPHLLFHRDTGAYLDISQGVVVGDHVWIGENVYITKSAAIADDCIVGACSVVTRRFGSTHVALAGNPARVVREGVQWIRNPGKLEAGTVYEAAYREHMAGFPRPPAEVTLEPSAAAGLVPLPSHNSAPDPTRDSSAMPAVAPDRHAKDLADLIECWQQSPHPTAKISSYFPTYVKLFAHLRGRPCTFVETGVLNGGSLFMWKRWLGEQARIVGIDLNPEAEKWREAGFEIHIGDQGDPAFWRDTLAKIGRFDVLLDDGGHQSFQQIVTVQEALRDRDHPCLVVIEDTATSFMRDFARHGEHTFLEYAKDATDCLVGRSFASMYPGRFPADYNRAAVAAYQAVASVEFFNGIVAFRVDPAGAVTPRVLQNKPPGAASDFRYEGKESAEVDWPHVLQVKTVTVRGGAAGTAAPGVTEGLLRLNLGCGNTPLTGYVNVDAAAAATRSGRQPDVCCDIQRLVAFTDNCADEVMALHAIERFPRWEAVDLVKEWVRVLKPGGKLVLEGPNLITACEELLKNPDEASRPDQSGSRAMWSFYGDPSRKDPQIGHRWLYTPQSLAQVMHEAGLRQLAQTPPQFGARHPRDMRVEGIKPLPGPSTTGQDTNT